MWLWVSRGEGPSAPAIFIRPVLNILLKDHFARRLRRLRQEIALHDGLADATQSVLLSRLDAALERWKPPRFGILRLTVLWTVIISLPAWSKQLNDFLTWLGIQPDSVAKFFSENISTTGLLFFGWLTFGYLLAVPVTAFVAKRGLFIGADPIWFPGFQDGSGAYLKEREILGSCELHLHEAPLDLWILGPALLLGAILGYASFPDLWVQSDAWLHSWLSDRTGLQIAQPKLFIEHGDSIAKIEMIVIYVFFGTGFFIAALRRWRTGRV